MLLFMMVALPLVTSGTISLGSFFACSFIHQIFNSYVTRIFFAIIQKNQLHVVDQRASELFDEASPSEEGTVSPSEDAIAFNDELVFSKICYEYEPGSPVLRDISLNLTKGSVTAIKGQSGIGKSTMLRLIAGLMTPTSGVMSIDGVVVHPAQIKELVFLRS